MQNALSHIAVNWEITTLQNQSQEPWNGLANRSGKNCSSTEIAAYIYVHALGVYSYCKLMGIIVW